MEAVVGLNDRKPAVEERKDEAVAFQVQLASCRIEVHALCFRGMATTARV
jgi:hypothetical protein